jgi:hypothetical protein
MLRLSLAVKESRESMYSVLNSLGANGGSTRSRMDRRLGGGSAAMLAKLSSNQLSRNDKLLHSVRSNYAASCNPRRHNAPTNPLAAGGHLQWIFFF